MKTIWTTDGGRRTEDGGRRTTDEGRRMVERLRDWLRDARGDMAEKAVVWVLIILAAMGAFALLGGRIAEAVRAVAEAI